MIINENEWELVAKKNEWELVAKKRLSFSLGRHMAWFDIRHARPDPTPPKIYY